LLKYWRAQYNQAPYVLKGDDILLETRVSPMVITLTSYEEYIRSTHLEDGGGSKLHLGLLPLPFVGNVEAADVFVLSLNPGISATDYFGEYQVPEFREAVVRNIRQTNQRDRYPNYFLNPAFSWHGGYRYWESKLRWLAHRLAAQNGQSYQAGLSLVSKRVCFIELVPYHSSHFSLPDRVIRELRSVQEIRRLVTDVVVPRALKGDAVVIAMRQAKQWALPKHRNAVVYEGAETRSAHLSPQSRGGQVLARHFGVN
jgi:hypothetical protein